MWDDIIKYLKDPLLVVKVQNFFGVLYKKRIESDKTNTNYKLVHSDRNTIREDEIEQKHHKRIPSDTSVISESCDIDTSNESQPTHHDEELVCLITNKFWFYLFLIGTEFGDEMFYAIFIPSWFWNVDSAVGRRVVLIWAVVMYIGQGFKDIIQWPRPGYPVKKLQEKWSVEYGMPSTHAMVGMSIPFSVVLFTMDRYQYPVQWGVFVAVLWCTLICVSRVYLGMHTVLDIAAGLLLSAALMGALYPVVDHLDKFLLTAPHAPLVVIPVSILLIVFYPQSDKWTPTRGDTTIILSASVGILTGSWANYQLGNMAASDEEPPYKIVWPSMDVLGPTLLRTLLGSCGVVVSRAIAKFSSYALVCALIGEDKNELRNSKDSVDNKKKMFVECSYKFLTYIIVGFNITYGFPILFQVLTINRPTYYSEI